MINNLTNMFVNKSLKNHKNNESDLFCTGFIAAQLPVSATVSVNLYTAAYVTVLTCGSAARHTPQILMNI